MFAWLNLLNLEATLLLRQLYSLKTYWPGEQTDDQVPCMLVHLSLVCFPAVLWHLDPSVTQRSMHTCQIIITQQHYHQSSMPYTHYESIIEQHSKHPSMIRLVNNIWKSDSSDCRHPVALSHAIQTKHKFLITILINLI